MAARVASRSAQSNLRAGVHLWRAAGAAGARSGASVMKAKSFPKRVAFRANP
ncbi:hypothetical protein BSIN_1539 [Burkholderia singularis]|uniref:Uncharacterized protein n=1 Tax=Burkholderia singularis TaxID=1503053 RepID=A0A238GZ52_9BURK|nr:hypothetical protein BSIN_1539 [Burkholderia singularis]